VKSRTAFRLFGLTTLVILPLILFYQLFLRHSAKVGEVATARNKPTVKIDFVFPNKNGVIGVTENTPANNIRVLLVAVAEYGIKYNSLPSSLSCLGPASTGKEANRDAANFIDSRLASGRKNGYI